MTARALPLLAALGLAACDAPFVPAAPSGDVFSLSGYLDASADTQWVRVEALLPTTEVSSETLAVDVTLGAPGGAVHRLAQEVRATSSGPAHLFWTAAPVEAGATYRLEARRPDGASTATTVPIPAETFEVEVETGPFVCPAVVRVRGAERVPDVLTRFVVRRGGRVATHQVSHPDRVERRPDGSVEARFYYHAETEPLGAGAEVLEAEIVVAVATAAWPDLAGSTLEEVVGYDDPAVEAGRGFVGGLVTRAVPYPPPQYCYSDR